MSDNTPTPTPSNPLERVFNKLSSAMEGYTSLLQTVDHKITQTLSKLETIEKRLDDAVKISRSSQNDTRLISKDLANLLEAEKAEREELADIRRSIVEQQLKVAEAGINIKEARQGIRDLTPMHGVPLMTQEELVAEKVALEKADEDDPSPKKVVGALIVIGKTVRKYWKGISFTAVTAVVHATWDRLAVLGHAIARWLVLGQ